MDAGLVASAREIAVGPHWQKDPFACLKRELRGLALGYGFDIDDTAAHPVAKQHVVPIGKESGRLFLRHRDTIMTAQAERLFPSVPHKEARARMKGLYNSLNMDGTFTDWALKWDIPPATPMAEMQVKLPGGDGVFSFASYLRELESGTRWLETEM